MDKTQESKTVRADAARTESHGLTIYRLQSPSLSDV